MRPFEIILILFIVLAFLILVISRDIKKPVFTWIFVALPPVAIIQIAGEGFRWQMIPGYCMAGLFMLIWLLKSIRKTGILGRNHHKKLFLIAGIFCIAISVVLPIIMPVFKLPEPSGPYKIGTVTYCWTDASRPELFTADPGDKRKLMVQIWYPSDENKSSPTAPYVQNAGELAPLAELLRLPGFMLDHLQYITTNSVASASASGKEEKYPVLIFSHGRGGYRQENTSLIEEIVSHGYIVAAIDHSYAASGVEFPDGSVAHFDKRMWDREFVDSMIPYLARDAVFTLNKLTELNQNDPNGILTGKLNLQQAGIAGLSLGGEISAEACLIDKRFQACIIIDTWMPKDVLQQGLEKPAMWISRDEQSMRLEGWTEAAIAETQTSMQTAYENLPNDGYIVRAKGMFHQDFSDAPLLSPLTRALGITGPIGKERARAITSAYVLAFFDRYLKGRQSVLLSGPSSQYPEVLFEKHLQK